MGGTSFTEEQVQKIGSYLRDESKPLKGRFRALFTLRNINTSLAVREICQCFSDPSALLKHELAYCLGQMQAEDSVPMLISTLATKEEHPMVRHECGEALGAIAKGTKNSAITPLITSALEDHKKDPYPEVAETCQLALNRVLHLEKSAEPAEKLNVSKYNSVDPAFPSSCQDVTTLGEDLLSEENDLWKRYRAMFALRDIGSPESIALLGKALKCGSALFRHEIAFVLGQLQSPLSVTDLTDSLADLAENEMVRHECAEALGAIGTPECEEILKKFLEDKEQVVRESVEVALDICEYEMTGDFQYANSLQTVST